MDNGINIKEKKSINPTAKLVICALLVFASTLAYSPTSGVLRTIPFMFLCALVCGLFKASASLVLSLSGTFCLVVYLALGSGVFESVVFTLLALFQALGGLYFAKLFALLKRTDKKKIKSKCLLLCAFDVAFCIVVTCLLCGNAVSFVLNKNENIEYIKKNYKNEIKVNHTAYSFEKGRYLTYVSFEDSAFHIGDNNDCFISCSDGKELFDNVRDYYEEKMLKTAELDLSKLVSNSTSAFEVVYSGVDFKEGEVLKNGADYKDYAERVSYVVAFYSIIEKEEIFENLCSDVLKTLEEENFEFENITFCAGKSDELLFSLTVGTKDVGEKAFGKTLKFDEKTLSEYGIFEKDVLKFWENE